jgi:hypothetical protein
MSSGFPIGRVQFAAATTSQDPNVPIPKRGVVQALG